jgi:ribose transport system ATP-binding protein
MTASLRLSGIFHRFGATVALDGASLEVRPGEVHALLGENGAGKSTLLAVLGGLLVPQAGTMEMGGVPYAPRSAHDAREHGIALIHQELSLFPHLTRDVLAEFGHPEIHPDATVGRLPIGARQVVEICRAISARARVVLMDEPTSSLPRGDVERLFATIGRLSAAGVAVVYISHFLEETRAVASAFTVLRDGRTVGTGTLSSVTNDELIALMVGRTVGELFPRRAGRPTHDVALEVAALAAPGLREASFSLRRGEVLGIFGLMGSGRTEMVRALFGLVRPASGSVSVGGRVRPLQAPPVRRLTDGLGYLSEDRKGEGLALPLSVADNVTVTRLASCSRRGVLDPALQRRQAAERAGELHVRLRGPGQAVRTLSGGNQQKVAFARLVHQEADVLLLDEPTRGVDVGSKAQIYEAVARAADRGKGVLMVSSYLPELLGVCDRLAVMSRGRLGPARAVADWTPETVLEAAIGA